MQYTHPSAIVMQAYSHTRSRDSFMSVADSMGASKSVAAKALTNLISGNVAALIVSGPQASGKDTIGPAVMAALGYADHIRIGIADSLKQEVTDVLELLVSLSDVDSAMKQTENLLDVSGPHAKYIVDVLWNETRDSFVDLTGWSRTAGIRKALQYLGNEARENDPTRYVRLAVPRILDNLAQGISLYMGDGRFPREAAPCSALGMYLVRLYVDSEVKAARLLARDGVIADPSTLHHEGEFALDSWEGIDLKINNSYASSKEVVCVIAGAFASHRARLALDLK